MRRGVLFPAIALAATVRAATVGDCPGYVASDVVQSGASITASLKLAGPACNVYGQDLTDLVLSVEYQTDTRLHVKIYDAAQQVYQVPSSVLAPPTGADLSCKDTAALEFVLVEQPFSFAVRKRASGETIFNTSSTHLVFESQYLRLRTSLPSNPNIYGLGEDTDAFRRNTTDYTRTLWSRDAYLVPSGTNLYGNHPVYFENRQSSNETHGVFLFNSNGMDIKINETAEDGQYLEYNVIGGVVDLYFLAGPGPIDVAQQYSEVVGKPAMMPYWGLGFHQCRYGMGDYMEVAEVVLNYSLANIPLETMWTDIDYMDARKIFTLDQQRFPLEKVQELVTYLHHHNQHYIVMVDPAVAYQNYSAFEDGARAGIFLHNEDGSIYQGVVWPGVTVYPDWFNPNTQGYWNNEFDTFFNAETGVDIDALWIDMNEASNFCVWPCTNATAFAIENGFPPRPRPLRTSWEPLPGFPADFQPPSKRQATGSMMGLPGRDLINPPYMINNAGGSLSNHTISSNLVHANGLTEYDTHNLYGTMMSSASRQALLSRRPTLRPMVITRSTFAGAGAKVGHWLGDNVSTWDQYRNSIAGILAFAGIYQVPMVGADVCGYAGNTTSTLCARWATLGAFYPFYRNHDSDGSIPQEFYRWPMVTSAARNAIGTRYRLLDYLYTAMYKQSSLGTPTINALWFLYPNDANTLPIDLQFFFGSSVLVSPVTEENSTSVSIYLPDDIFYDFNTHEAVRGHAGRVMLDNVAFDAIPLHIRGGSILPLRLSPANTTAALREMDFELVIAPGLDGRASGMLYLDDGVSLVQGGTSLITFDYSDADGLLKVGGTFGYATPLKVAKITLLGGTGGSGGESGYGSKTARPAAMDVQQGLTEGWEVKLK